MATSGGGGNEVGAVRKSLQLIETLKDLDGAGVTELANELGCPKSTIHSHLKTLENAGYIIKDGDAYVLGFRFVDLGEHARTRDKVYSLVESRIEELAKSTGERVQFVITEHGDCVYVRIAEGRHAVSTGSRLGRRRHMLHCTAAGKSILAYLDREEIADIFEWKGLPQRTPNTITNMETLYRELEEVAARGYAFNHEEHIEGLHAVAAPVKRPNGKVVGSVSVSGPVHRLHGDKLERELPEALLGVCNEIELDIIYQ